MDGFIDLSLEPRFGGARPVHGFRLAEADEGAGVAETGGVARLGGGRGFDHGADLGCDFEGEGAQRGVEGNFCAASAFAVEELAAKDAAFGALEDLLEADRLAAELDLVGLVGLRLSALVLDGDDVSAVPDFNYIAEAGEAVALGLDGEAASDANAGARLAGTVVSIIVKYASLRRAATLGPLALDMDERALPRTVEVVLQRGQGDEVGVWIHRMGSLDASVESDA